MLRFSRIVSTAAAGTAVVAAAVGSVALLAPAAGAHDASAATAKVYVAAKGCTGRAYRPTKLILACADANLYVTGLKYSSYGGATATATGTIHVNECKPNCAAGMFRVYPGTIELGDLVRCSDGRTYYGKAKYDFKAKHGKGNEDVAPTRLRCKASS